jgi:hypothetical protein
VTTKCTILHVKISSSVAITYRQVIVCEDNQRKAFFVMHGKCRGRLECDIDYSDICENDHSSSVTTCATGFRAMLSLRPLNGEPSSSLRGSEPSSSFLTQNELGAPPGRFARDRNVLRLLMQKNRKATRSKPPAAAATPIPAFAPVDKALLCVIVGIGDTAAVLLLGAEIVLDGWAVDEGGGLGEVVVEKSTRSVSWYSTYRGCAHIVSGPVTVVVFMAAG